MLSLMADDFTGVPSDQWWRLHRDTSVIRLYAVLAFALVVLLVLTLIEKGVLSGWSDLFRTVHAHE